MAEENKGNILEQAKDMLGGKGNVLDAAKNMLGDNIGNLLKDSDGLKKKATELGQKIAPDSLDDKVEDAVEKAVDFLKDALGKK
ncbi:MAG: hypothetical protein KBT10_03185 [Bacteroidales bacterium]|nr:hypothetical protein [Candidatus Sodaliphilus aphodohippi]